jgi:hypothetical protein
MALSLTPKEHQMLTAVIQEMNEIPSVRPFFLHIFFDSFSALLLPKLLQSFTRTEAELQYDNITALEKQLHSIVPSQLCWALLVS